jgi:LuxR family maltose regulon positive regulatory protein
MDSDLLASKLEIPPLRARLVARQRLLERLDSGLNSAGPETVRLVLVSAPAGFGKTTLLSAWVRGSRRRAAWLSLDEGDNDPARFLAYLLEALRAIEPALGDGRLETLQPAGLDGPLGEARIDPFMSALANRLHGQPAPSVLVLDDYHLIAEEQVHRAVTFLLDHLPAQMLLAIASRSDPPLSLARLRARGQLVELRQGDLRFQPEEAGAFFQQLTALSLAPGQAQALAAQTEGWAAGLQLAGLALRGQQAELAGQSPDTVISVTLIGDQR